MSNEGRDFLKKIDSILLDWNSLVEKGFYIIDSSDSFRSGCGACVNVDAIQSICSIHNVSVNMECWSCGQFVSTRSFRVDSEIPLHLWSSLEFTANVAFDGAQDGDADCQYIIGAFCAHVRLHQIIRDRVSKECDLSKVDVYLTQHELISADHWFVLAAKQSDNLVGSKLARRMLDPDVPESEKRRNIEIFWRYSGNMLEKSGYYTNS